MKRSLLFIVLGFTLLSFAVFATAVYGQPERKAEKEVAKERFSPPRGFLNLTPEQKAKLEEFRKMRQEERQEFQKKMRPLRDELHKLLQDPNSSQKDIDSLIDQIAKLQSSHFKRVVQQRREMRKVFTPEQLEKLDKLKKRMADRRGLLRERFMDRRGFFRHGPLFWRQWHFRGGPFMDRWRRW